LHPAGVAVDGGGNIYVADTGHQAVEELPYAFVDPTPKVETVSAGSDVFPTVLPATANLLPPFAFASDAPWLTITGASNGVVSFAFTANVTTNTRTANVTVLGQSMAVTQSAAASIPPVLTAVQLTGNGIFNFVFTNLQGASFTVWTTTNLLQPPAGWTVAGTPTNNGSGLYQFATPAVPGDLQRFYRVTSP
jgi:hypothetical protein